MTKPMTRNSETTETRENSGAAVAVAPERGGRCCSVVLRDCHDELCLGGVDSETGGHACVLQQRPQAGDGRRADATSSADGVNQHAEGRIKGQGEEPTTGRTTLGNPAPLIKQVDECENARPFRHATHQERCCTSGGRRKSPGHPLGQRGRERGLDVRGQKQRKIARRAAPICQRLWAMSRPETKSRCASVMLAVITGRTAPLTTEVAILTPLSLRANGLVDSALTAPSSASPSGVGTKM